MLLRREFLSVLAVSGGAIAGCRSESKGFRVEALANDDAMDSLIDYDAVGMAELIKRGDVSQQELLAVIKNRIERLNPKINCLAVKAFERAETLAGSFDASSVFSGVPFVLKDMVDVGGLSRTDGSRLMENNIPQSSVPYTQALEEAGLNIMGSTTTPEFASGLETELYGRTLNPWDFDYTCMLSSSGSAAAVASGMLPLVHGTDGGGSNRLPASACHLFGFKPSRYRMLCGEKEGVHDRFKTNGPISRSVRDAAMLFSVTEDRRNEYYDPVGLVLTPSKKRLKIAYARNGIRGYDVDPAIQRVQDSTVALLEGMGHQVEEIIHPVDAREFYEKFTFAYMPKWLPILSQVKALTGMSVAESGLMSDFTRTMIESAKGYSEEQIRSGQSYLETVEALYDQVFDHYDVLLSPVMSKETLKQGVLLPADHWDEKQHLLKEAVAITAPVNGEGGCAMSVPAGFSDQTGMPVGSMFHAKAGSDKMLFELAYELEQTRPWKDQWAPYSAKMIV